MFDLLKLKFKVIGIPGSMTKSFSGSTDLKQKQSQRRLLWFFLTMYLDALMRFRWGEERFCCVRYIEFPIIPLMDHPDIHLI
jgi:hypothetical protein